MFDLENANGLCPKTLAPVGASNSLSQTTGFVLGKTPIVCKESSCYSYTKADGWKVIATSTEHQLGFSYPFIVNDTTALLAAGKKEPGKTSFLSLGGMVELGPSISK